MMDLCVTKFKESEGVYVGPKEAGYCLLRSQLLMAFHDSPSFRHLANEVLQPHLSPCQNQNAPLPPTPPLLNRTASFSRMFRYQVRIVP